jgi:hypothetical protein
VGIKDPLGNITSRIPDPLTGIIVEVASDYSDEPGIRRKLDASDRVEKEYAKPSPTPAAGRAWLVTARMMRSGRSRW